MSDVEITRCERPTAGFSSETLLVDARGSRGGDTYAESLVVRLAPSGLGVFPEYDLAVQARAQEGAAANGIPAAVPVELETDPRWVGADFLVMPVIEGHVPEQAPVADRLIMSASPETQADLSRGFIDTLAAIHRVDWRAERLDAALPVRDLDADLAYWARYLDWYGQGTVLAPALVDALAWCAEHRPGEPAHSLLWGDVRLGNVIFDAEWQLVAVLDWEMTTIGPAEHDVAWHLALEAMQNELFGRAVPGFLDRDASLARYEAALGRRLMDLEWFEIFALVRSTAIMTRIAFVQEHAGEQPMLPYAENPVLEYLARRIAAAS